MKAVSESKAPITRPSPYAPFPLFKSHQSSLLTSTSRALKSGKTFFAYGSKPRNITLQKMLPTKTIHRRSVAQTADSRIRRTVKTQQEVVSAEVSHINKNAYCQ